MADPITLTVDDRARWADEAADAVDAAAADVRRRMDKALSKKVPPRARTVFRASWWDQAVDRHVAPVFERIASEAAAGVGGNNSGDAARQALDMLAERTSTVRARVRDLHAQAVREGWTGQRLATELGVRGGSGPMSADSARAIGRGLSTSVMQGAAHGALVAAGADGVTKTWHCAFLPASRTEHRKANGQTVPIDEPFQVAGHDAMYPGDPALPVGQTAGCHCWVTYETTADAVEALSGDAAWDSLPRITNNKWDVDDGYADISIGDASAAIKDYTAKDYQRINGALRKKKGSAGWPDDEDWSQHVSLIDGAIDKVELPEPIEVWRGLSGHDPALDVGGEFVDWSFVSTTTDPKVAATLFSDGVDPVVLRMRLEAGTNALPMKGGLDPGLAESEVLLPRGQTYRIVGSSTETVAGFPDIRVLDVELVKPVTASAAPHRTWAAASTDDDTPSLPEISEGAAERLTMRPEDVEIITPAPATDDGELAASPSTEDTPMDSLALPGAHTFAVPSGRVVVTVEPTAAEKQALAAFADAAAELHVPLLDVGDLAALTPDARTALAGALAGVASVTPPLSGTINGVGWLDGAGVTVGLVDCPGLGALRGALTEALVDMAPAPGEFQPVIVLTAGSIDATAIAGVPIHFNELRVRAGAETLVFDLLGPLPVAPELADPEPETPPTEPEPDPEPAAEDPFEIRRNAVPEFGRVVPVPEPAPPEELPAMTTTVTNATGGNLTAPVGWRLVPATTTLTAATVGAVTFAEPGMAPEGDMPDEPPPVPLVDIPDADLEAEIARRAAAAAAEVTGSSPDELLADAEEETAGLIAEIASELEAGETAEEDDTPEGPPAPVMATEGADTFAGELAPDVDGDGIGESPVATDYDWEGILAIENTPTSDGRMFAGGALTWRTLPITLSLQTVTAPGHDGGVVCGSICEIERVGDNIIGRGRFSSTEAGELARTLIGEGSLHGVSIDVAAAVVVYINEDGEDIDPIDVSFGEPATAVFVEAEMMGAHLTPFPAFADARVDLLGDAPTSLVASGASGCWRLTGPALFTLLDGGTLATDALVASAAPAPPAPPASLFALKPDTREPFSVGAPLPDGTIPVYGLLADWNIPHIGHNGRKVYPPRGDDFTMFYTGKFVRTREGTRVPTGPIFIDTVHPNLAAQASDAQAFYAHTGSAVADVHLYNAEHGIVAAGVLRPGVDELTRRRMEGSDVSPDWRPINGQYHMVAILAVNASGFPVPYIEGIAASAGRLRSWVAFDETTGEPLAMVAVGSPPRERRPSDQLAVLQAQVEDNTRKIEDNTRKMTELAAAFFVAAGGPQFADTDPPEVDETTLPDNPDDPAIPDPDLAPDEDAPVELSADERAARAQAARAALGIDHASRAARARASLGILEPVG